MNRWTRRPLSPEAVEARQRRRIAMLPATGFFAVQLAAAWPAKELSSEGIGYAALLAAFGAFLLFLGVRRRQPFLAMLAVLFTSAYSPGLGDAVSLGLPLDAVHMTPSAESVRGAVLLLILFLGTLAAGTVLFQAVIERWLPGMFDRREEDERLVWLGLGIILVTSFAFSLATGAWTTYGANVTGVARDGTFRFEFFYDPALFSTFGLTTTRLSQVYALPAGRRKHTGLLWALLVVVFALMFTRQIRRMMVASIVLGVVAIFDRVGAAVGLLRAPGKLIAGGVLLVTLIAGVFVGSNAWRRSAMDFSTNSISDRLSDVSNRIGDTSSEQLAQDRERLTYLWLDSATVEHADVLSGILTLDDMFIRSVIVNIPGMLFRAKYLYPQTGCETAFMRIGVDTDLPCTPQSEGYLAMGLLGVMIVALSWAPIIAFATALYRRGRALAIVAAMHVMLPLTSLETSAFPTILALRMALLGVTFVGGIALVLQVLRGRRVGVTRRPAMAPAARQLTVPRGR